MRLRSKTYWGRREADPGIYNDLLSAKIWEFLGGTHKQFESASESFDSYLLRVKALLILNQHGI